MAPEEHAGAQAIRASAREDISKQLLSGSEDIVRSLIDNPHFNESNVCALLERKDLTGALLEDIANRKTWVASYRVRRALAAHPHTPRLVAVRLLRDLHLMDLLRISSLPSSSGELRRLAEERVLVQLPQLPMGQRLMLARRASARIAAGLILQGPEQVARVALDSAFLNESQLLKTLAKQSLPAQTVAAVARHAKWSKQVNVRLALLRHAHTTVECVAAFVPDLPRREIEDLLGLPSLPGSIRARLRGELARRERPSGKEKMHDSRRRDAKGNRNLGGNEIQSKAI